MSSPLWSRRRRRGRSVFPLPSLECLEGRTLLSGNDTLATALPIALTPDVPLQQSGTLATDADRALYAVTLPPGSSLTANLDPSSSLFGLVRIFNAQGVSVAANGIPGPDTGADSGGQRPSGVDLQPLTPSRVGGVATVIAGDEAAGPPVLPPNLPAAAEVGPAPAAEVGGAAGAAPSGAPVTMFFVPGNAGPPPNAGAEEPAGEMPVARADIPGPADLILPGLAPPPLPGPTPRRGGHPGRPSRHPGRDRPGAADPPRFGWERPGVCRPAVAGEGNRRLPSGRGWPPGRRRWGARRWRGAARGFHSAVSGDTGAERPRGPRPPVCGRRGFAGICPGPGGEKREPTGPRT
jgi:hypothetical protein